MGSWKKYFGPGPIVAAAFIGPGTVTVCTLAGVNFGYELLWALGLSTVTTIVLQEMSARIGLVTQRGLAENIAATVRQGALKYLSLSLVLLAVVLGNAAYEAGNISGATMGAEMFVPISLISFGGIQVNLINLLIGILAFMLLLTGSYQKIARVLTFLVVSMSLAFLVNAFLSAPDWAALIEGFVPTVSESNIITTVALVGTTVVPYNLFLHSSLVTQRWKDISGLKYARMDTCIAVIIGGLVSMAIVVTGVKGQSLEVTRAADLAVGLEPLMGAYAKYFMAFGLFAAGLTSAMTAPLAGALVIAGCFGWSTALHSRSMKWSVSLILGLGLLFSSLGIKPVQLITIAQLANGILLPLLSAYVIWIINKKTLMGRYTNSPTVNVLTWVVWLITLGLGWLSIYKVLVSMGLI